MRTRLDEIIEEALGKDAILDIHAYAAAKLIARGAFRHGVEQTYRVIPPGQYFVPAAGVQPAPASEKCDCGCGHPKTCEGCLNRDESWKDRVGKWGHACTNACYVGMGHFVPDRRVGQRRRPDPPPRRGTVSEYKTTGISTNEVYTYNTTGSQTFWGTDRRSGTDRRKP